MKRVDVDVHGFLIEPWESDLLNAIRARAYEVFNRESDKLTALKELLRDGGIPLEAGFAMWEDYHKAKEEAADETD